MKNTIQLILLPFVLALSLFGQNGSTILISTHTPVIAATTLAIASQGVAYSQTLSTTGGVGACLYTITSATLPPAGITLNGSTGVISGTTAAAAAAYPFTVICTDTAYGTSAPVAFSITVQAAGATLVIDTTTVPDATVNVAYSASLSAHGGTGTGFVWSLFSGTPPTGLSVNSSGSISGTPTVVTVADSFTIRVTDSGSNTANQVLVMNVNAATSSCGPPTYPCSVTDSTNYPPTSNTIPNFNSNFQGTWAGHNAGPYGAGIIAHDTGFPSGKNIKMLRLSDFSQSRTIRTNSGGGHNVISQRQPNGRVYIAAPCYGGSACMWSFDEDLFASAADGQSTLSRLEYLSGSGYFAESVNWPRSGNGASITFAALIALVSPPAGSLYNCSNCTVANPTAGGGAGAVVYRSGGVWIGYPTTPAYSFYAMYNSSAPKFGRFTINPSTHTFAQDGTFTPPDPNGATCLNGAGNSYQNNFQNNTERIYSAQLSAQDTGFIGAVVDMDNGCRTYNSGTMQVSNGYNTLTMKDLTFDTTATASLQRTITSRSRTSGVATVVFSANIPSSWIADSFCRANITGVSDVTFRVRGVACNSFTTNSVSYPDAGADVASTPSGGTFTLGEALHDSGMDKTGRYVGLGLKHSPVNGAGAQIDLNTDIVTGCPASTGSAICANHQDGAYLGDFSQNNNGNPWKTVFLHIDDKSIADFCTSFGSFPAMQDHLSGNTSESALDRKMFIMSTFTSPQYPDPANTTNKYVNELLGHDCVTGLIHRFGHNWLSGIKVANGTVPLASQGVCQNSPNGKYAVCATDMQAYKDADGVSMVDRGWGNGSGANTCDHTLDVSISSQVLGCRTDLILYLLQ